MFARYKKIMFIVILVLFVGIGFLIYIKRDYFFGSHGEAVIGAKDQVSGGETKNDYIKDVSQTLIETKVTTRRELIETYCKVIMDKRGFTDTDNGFEYNPSKSAFVYGICGAFEDQGFSFDSTLTAMTKSVGYIKSNNKKIMQGVCDPYDKKNDMNGCQFSRFLSKIFASVMNDYSNIKLASVYGFIDKDIDISINEFSEKSFGKDICGSGGGKQYISKEDSDSEDVGFCSHPQTYKILSDYIKDVKKFLENSNYVDAKKAIEQSCDDANFLTCAFKSSDAEFSSKFFKNLLMNDLLYYSLLLSYYSSMITYDNSLSPLNVTQYASDDLNKNFVEVEVAKKEIQLAQQSIGNMIRLLVGIKNTFPIHIGLKAYNEDVANFRKEFVKIYTPIEQMTYKTRNYQDARR